jgi:predicted nucleic acid-binding protein
MRLPQLTGCFRHLPDSTSARVFTPTTKAYTRLTFSILRSRKLLRRLASQGVISADRADEAMRNLLDLRITRYPHQVLLRRIWQLRHNFSAYDAAYIVLAEKLRAAWVTRDARLASASGHAATVELF